MQHAPVYIIKKESSYSLTLSPRELSLLLNPSPIQLSLCILSRFDGLIFMNSSTSGASTVSCKSGNKNNLFFWILFCLLPKFLGTFIAYVNFLLIKAVDRCPSVICVLDNCVEITL